jgi:hypothetical protein
MVIEINKATHDEDRPYEELSEEFKAKWPTAIRALELIPLMYNRLTRKEGYSHKAAINKIYNDHAHLPGFSKRNIRRNLPSDSPTVPRRIRPSWPKTSITKSNNEQEFSDNESDKVRREDLTKSTFKAADGLPEESTRPNERPSEQKKMSLEPYECKAELEVEGRLIPLHVYCTPAKRTVRVEIDTKRVGTGRYA